jgi:spore coat protein U domain-containing protein, fimbrial subunit CupE1/2/3/6
MHQNARAAARFLLAAAAAALVCADASAGSTTSTVTVSATVSQTCLVSTTPVAFGTYDPVSSNSATGSDVASNGSVSVTCTRSSTGVSITLGPGGNAEGAQRRLAGGGSFLNYQLYHPSATTPAAACGSSAGTVWSTTGGGIFTPTGVADWGASSPKSFNICGLVPRGQDVPAASYSDSVLATINF